MYNCLQKKTSRFRKILTLFIVLTVIQTGLTAENATITNPNDTTGWGENDTVAFTTAKTITFPASSTITIENLMINANNNVITLDLNGSTLIIKKITGPGAQDRSGRLRLGKDNAGQLVIKNGTLIADEFDTNDDDNNSLSLENTSVTINQSLLTNGTGTTTITGDTNSSFIIPKDYNNSYAEAGDGNVLYFPGVLQPVTNSAISADTQYSITTSGAAAPGKTVTITISCTDPSTNPATPKDFSSIAYKATITGTGDTFVINGENISATTTRTITQASPSPSMSFTAVFPDSMAIGNSLELTIYDNETDLNLLSTSIYYKQFNNTTWTGESDTDWNKASNWNHGIPVSNMTVIIPNTTNTPEITGTTNNKLAVSVENGATLTINGSSLEAASITNKGTITLASSGIINVTGDVTNTNGTISGSGSLTFTGNAAQTFAAANKTYTGITVVENKSTTAGSLTISGNCTLPSFMISNGKATTFSNQPTISSFTAAATAGDITFSDNAIIRGPAEINYPSITASNTITFTDTISSTNSDPLTVNGKLIIGSTTTGGINVSKALVATDDVTFYGDNTLTSFTGTSPSLAGKKFTFESGKTQTIGTLTISGSSGDGNKVILEGTSAAAWELTCTSYDIQYVDVKNSTATNTLFALFSKDSSGNTNWVFPGMKYTWKGGSGADGSDWFTAANWNEGTVPTKGSEIEIQTVAAGNKYPVLALTSPATELDMTIHYDQDYKGKITVFAGASFSLAEYSLKIGEIINNGTILAKGVSGQQVTADTITNGTNSTFEYYDDGIINLFWNNNQYNNLTISGQADYGNPITVSGTTSITAASSKTVTLDSTANVFTGNVILGDSGISTGDVTLAAAGTINLENNANAASLTIQTAANIQNVTTSGAQNYNGDTVISSAAAIESTGGNIIFAAGTTLSVNADTTITVPASKYIDFNGSTSGSGKLSTAGSGLAKFNASITGLNELETQAVQINCAAISTGGDQTYNGATEITVNTELSAPANKLIQFNAAVSGTVNLKTSGAAVAEFKNTVNIVNLETQVAKINTTSTITSSGTQIYNGTVELAENTSLSAGTSVTFNANVSGAKSLTVSGPLNVNCSQITTTGNSQNYNGVVNLDLNSKFTASQINFNSNITDGAVAGSRKNLTVDAAVLKSTIASGSASIILGELKVDTNTSIQTNNGTTIAFNVPLISGTGKTITLASSGSTFTFDGDVEINPDFITSAGTTFTASTGVMTFKADLDLTNGTFTANGGNIVLSAANKAGAAALLKGSKTYNNLEFTGPVNIQGNNIISTLTANAASLAGKTITFDAGTLQTVTNMSLKGSGTGATQVLTLNSSGSGNWNISCTNEPELQYLSVSKSTNSSSATNFVALNSIDAGGDVNWNFPDMPYKWTGGTSSVWTDTANWQNNVVPTKGANVEIAAGTYYPILTADLDLNTSLGSTPYNGIITIDSDATFDLGGQNVTAGQIINNGRVRLTGASTPAQTLTFTRTNNTDSIVEYYGTGSSITNFAWGQIYEKLEINESAEIHTALSINKTTAITAASTKTVTLDSTANVFTGNVILGTATSSTGNVTLAANGLITLANNAKAVNLTIQTAANIQNVTTSGKQNYNGDITISSAAEIKTEAPGDDITFAAGKSLSVNAAATLSVPASKYINFNATTTGTAKLTTTGAGIAKFTGNVSNLAELETQSVDFNCETLSTTGAQTYNGAAVISRTGGSTISSSGGAITFTNTSSITGSTNKLKVETGTGSANSITFAGEVGTSASPFVELEIRTARETSFVNTIYLDTLTTSGSSGDITFQNGGRITNALSFSTTGNVTLTGTLQAPSLSVANTFTADGTANVNTTTTQNYNGNVIINNGSTLNIQNATDVTLAAGKTVSGNEFKITTAANTIFNGSVSLSNFTDTGTAGNIYFNAGGSIAAASGQTFATTSIVTFGNDSSDSFIIGSTGAEKDLTHITGNTVINGQLTAANITLGNTSGGPMTITNSGLLKTDDTKAISYTTSFTQNGTGNTILKGNFGSSTGTGTASFATSVQLDSGIASTFGTSGDTTTIAGNLIITAPAAGVTINSQITTQGNIVAYKGPVTVNANISASNDILVLGNSYSEQDNSTNISNEYSYTLQRPSGSSSWSSANYNAASLPDGNTLPPVADYSASLSVATDKIIYAGKNFYANGTTLSGSASGSWNLKLPDLTNPANGFAEAYHSTISKCNVICTDGTSDGSKARLVTLECTDSGSNQNVDFGDFEIIDAYTVRDNVIYVELNRPVRYHSTSVSLLKFNNSTSAPDCNFSSPYLYSDADCTTQLNYDTQLSYFYIKAEPQNSATTGAWNTDATGRNEGSSNSSDRFGTHHNTMPCLDFPRSLQAQGASPTIPFILTDRWGKRLTNYSRRVTKAAAAEPAYGSADSTYDVEDKTGPVLWTVRTGQEIHNAYEAATGETSQHSYDAHNFLEFRYSEPVDFGSSNPSICNIDIPAYSAGTTPNVVENIQVTDSFGAIQENIAVTTAGTLSFSGLAKIHDVILYTGSQGSANKYVNALYRTDEYSLRLSVAGWTDGTISDYTGNAFKKWPGYIEKATQFTSKNVTAIATSNTLVKDQEGNVQIEYPVSPVQPQIISDSTNLLTPPSPDVYSAWDLSEPIFAPLRLSRETAWGDTEYSEAVGNTNGTGSTLDRIDFHLFDNTPTYTSADEAEWFTEIGWCLPGSEASKDNLKDTYTYCSDIIGGSRQFDTDAARRTSGGIRMSTKLGIAQAFKYSTDTEAIPDQPFDSDLSKLHTTVISSLFTSSSNPRRPINEPDSLYLGIGLTDTSLAIETTFSFSYNEATGYMTDLAGNRLRTTVSRTVDRSVPSFNITLSPVSGKELFIIFVKQIITDSSKIKLMDNSGNAIPIQEDFTTMLPDCFQLISIADDGSYSRSTDIQIDTSIPAKIIPAGTNKYFTTFSLTLTKEVTYENLKNRYVQIKQNSNYPELTMDVFTNNTNSRVTLIQDKLGNYASMYSAHTLSDFAIGLINPLYGYSSDLAYDGEYVMNGLYEKGTWAVHDWNADQQNFGTLPANHPVAIVTTTKDGTPDNSQNPPKARIYYSNAPELDSVASQLNKDLNLRLRTWLPSLRDSLFPPFSRKNNDNFGYADSIPVNQNDITAGLLFNIGIDTVKTWNNGDQISFLFGILNDDGTPARIFNVPYYNVGTNTFDLSLSTAVPLYCLRMHNILDITTLDLWSFKIKSITEQRGGVTILNNVIAPERGEKTVVQVKMPSEGKLNVVVMTLDGNIITYLNRGKTAAGEYYFTWDGRNQNNNIVARGMYFIRVVGSDFDETRKVLVVKD